MLLNNAVTNIRYVRNRLLSSQTECHYLSFKGPYYLELVSAVRAQAAAGTATERTSTPACKALPWIEDKLLGVIHTALAFIIYGSAKL